MSWENVNANLNSPYFWLAVGLAIIVACIWELLDSIKKRGKKK